MSLMKTTLHIKGAWTKAGVVSCVHIQGEDHRKDDILFDCGVIEEGITSAKAVLISHGHTDHIGAAVVHARAKAFSGSPATYYVPHAIKDSLLKVKEGFEEMDGTTIPMHIVPIGPGDELMITKNVKVKVIPTDHRVPSQGYALYTLRPPRLLPQYQSLSSEEIGHLRKQGVTITTPVQEVLEMVYTGDTTFQGLLQPQNAFIFQAPTLIMELTYLDRDHGKAIQYGHVHIEDIIQHADLFQNENIVFVHLSQKYRISTALEILRERLPSSIAERAKVSLKSFGASQMLTDVIENRSNSASRGSYSSNGGSGGSGGGGQSRGFHTRVNRHHRLQPQPASKKCRSQGKMSYCRAILDEEDMDDQCC
eukprot:gene10908-12122_t